MKPSRPEWLVSGALAVFFLLVAGLCQTGIQAQGPFGPRGPVGPLGPSRPGGPLVPPPRPIPRTEVLWKCMRCGHVMARGGQMAPTVCPFCSARLRHSPLAPPGGGLPLVPPGPTGNAEPPAPAEQRSLTAILIGSIALGVLAVGLVALGVILAIVNKNKEKERLARKRRLARYLEQDE
jgi:hypothetical protein